MYTPTTKEEWEQIIYRQRRELFFEIANKFPAEEIERLRRSFAKAGMKQWWAWMYDNRAQIAAFLRNMPEECRRSLNYQENGLLYCAVMYYFVRALDLLETLDTVGLLQVDDQNPDEFYRAVAAAADAIDVLDDCLAEPSSLWPFPNPNPFDPQGPE